MKCLLLSIFIHSIICGLKSIPRMLAYFSCHTSLQTEICQFGSKRYIFSIKLVFEHKLGTLSIDTMPCIHFYLLTEKECKCGLFLSMSGKKFEYLSQYQPVQGRWRLELIVTKVQK